MEDDFTQRFKEGDFLQHLDPYEGESEKLIVKVDKKGKYYECVHMKGKHCKEPNFDFKEIFDFDVANRSLEKVG